MRKEHHPLGSAPRGLASGSRLRWWLDGVLGFVGATAVVLGFFYAVRYMMLAQIEPPEWIDWIFRAAIAIVLVRATLDLYRKLVNRLARKSMS